jgi:fatty-acid peroxygenase
VELINVVRPIVAVSRFIVFAALALHQHPEWRARLAGAPDDVIEAFVQEVRRVSPFFPFIGGRVREQFAWSGRSFAQGEWVLLDLYGTNRDARAFDAPDEFRPERFIGRAPDPFAFVPQGGGDVWSNHRCPGERITIDLMKTAVTLLTKNMEYDVPVQQLSVDLSQIPALPQSGFIMSHVRRHRAVPRGDNGS